MRYPAQPAGRFAKTRSGRHWRSAIGCLPIPFFFLLGFGLGHLLGGTEGALWGAGIGLAVGLAGMGCVIATMRGKR